jgi:hypothetical protein
MTSRHSVPTDPAIIDRCLIVYWSPSNPWWWGYHRYIMWERKRRGGQY